MPGDLAFATQHAAGVRIEATPVSPEAIPFKSKRPEGRIKRQARVRLEGTQPLAALLRSPFWENRLFCVKWRFFSTGDMLRDDDWCASHRTSLGLSP